MTVLRALDRLRAAVRARGFSPDVEELAEWLIITVAALWWVGWWVVVAVSFPLVWLAGRGWRGVVALFTRSRPGSP